MREWSPAARKGSSIGSTRSRQQKPAVQEVATLAGQEGHVRELRCLVHYMPSGLDLRSCSATSSVLPSSTRTRRAVQARADEWKIALLERGWV